MNVKTMVMKAYETPIIELIEVELEEGFVASSEPLGETYEEIGW